MSAALDQVGPRLEEMDPKLIHEMQLRRVTRAKCEATLLWFSRFFFKVIEGSSFLVNPHHRVVCDALMKVYRGEIKNLIINIPPGSSKTLLAVIMFMAWCIAKNPWCRFLHLSYAKDLVDLNSSTTKDLIASEEYQAMWPREISDDTKSKKRWNIMEGDRKAGGCYAVPLGGTITGFRGGYMRPGFHGAILIDDPLKPEDAFYPRRVASANRKLSDTVKSRKAWDATPIIMIMQRIGLDDPTDYAERGMIGGIKFEVIKIPAILDEGTDHERSYWEEKEPLAGLQAQREANPLTFHGQYQQEPRSLGGTVFKTKWWNYYFQLPPLSVIFIYADTAFKVKEVNDYSVFEVWGKGEEGIYLLDLIRGKWPGPDLEEKARDIWKKWSTPQLGEGQPVASGMKIEDKASGTGLVQSLMKQGRDGSPRIPVTPIPRHIDKAVRAMSVTPSVASGMVFLPDPDLDYRPWFSEFISEHADFKADLSHGHDDQVDPMMDAVEDMILGNIDFYAGAL